MSGSFKSGWSYIHYSETVRGRYRFAYPAEVLEFLQALVDTSESRIRDVRKGFPLWRAQLGNDLKERQIDDPELDIVVEDQVPLGTERMKPRRDAGHEGRANPKGIPCLYLATDKNTAMSEVRPWIGAIISLGRFVSSKDLRLVDLTIGHDFQLTPDHLFGPLPDEEMTKGVWAQVDKAFSTPVTDDPSTAEYVPTQVIAEFFRRAGYDGLVYRSTLGDGFNVALFDLEAASLVERRLHRAIKVSFQFGDVE